MEHHKSKSTQPNYLSRWTFLYMFDPKVHPSLHAHGDSLLQAFVKWSRGVGRSLSTVDTPLLSSILSRPVPLCDEIVKLRKDTTFKVVGSPLVKLRNDKDFKVVGLCHW